MITQETRWVVKGAALFILLVFVVALLVGCGDDPPNPRTDLDEDNITLDTAGWTVYANYDEFPNVAAKCDGSSRMYTTTRLESAIVVVPNSPECVGGDS